MFDWWYIYNFYRAVADQIAGDPEVHADYRYLYYILQLHGIEYNDSGLIYIILVYDILGPAVLIILKTIEKTLNRLSKTISHLIG